MHKSQQLQSLTTTEFTHVFLTYLKIQNLIYKLLNLWRKFKEKDVGTLRGFEGFSLKQVRI
jgi:hypothetical protein